MYKSPLVYLLIGICLAVSDLCGAETPQCKVNEVYRECKIPCLPSCANLNPPQCRPATCEPGCQCDWDYVSDEQGNCILASDCPNAEQPKCLEGEMPVSCQNPCPATCRERSPPLCKAHCVKGCNCKHGYVRDDNNKCIPLEDCPEKNS